MPISVTTRPRYKCQFCLSYRATLKAVERHEGFCWQNPDRFCDECENTGKHKVLVELRPEIGDLGWGEEPCPYCSKEHKTVTQALIEHNERS